MEVVRLSALRTGRLHHQGNIPGTHYCYSLSRPQGHNAARRIMPMKNSNDTMNRTRDRPACIAVPQPAALPCAPNVGVVSKLRPTTDSFHILPIHYSLIILSLHIT